MYSNLIRLPISMANNIYRITIPNKTFYTKKGLLAHSLYICRYRACVHTYVYNLNPQLTCGIFMLLYRYTSSSILKNIVPKKVLKTFYIFIFTTEKYRYTFYCVVVDGVWNNMLLKRFKKSQTCHQMNKNCCCWLFIIFYFWCFTLNFIYYFQIVYSLVFLDFLFSFFFKFCLVISTF